MPKDSQLDKFKAAAKEAECKMGPRKFDEALREVATSSEKDQPRQPPKGDPDDEAESS